MLTATNCVACCVTEASRGCGLFLFGVSRDRTLSSAHGKAQYPARTANGHQQPAPPPPADTGSGAPLVTRGDPHCALLMAQATGKSLTPRCQRQLCHRLPCYLIQSLSQCRELCSRTPAPNPRSSEDPRGHFRPGGGLLHAGGLCPAARPSGCLQTPSCYGILERDFLMFIILVS